MRLKENWPRKMALVSMLVLFVLFTIPVVPESSSGQYENQVPILYDQDIELSPESISTISGYETYTENFTTTTYKDDANTNASWFESGSFGMLSDDLPLIGSWDSPGFTRDVWIEGNYAYIAEDSFGLRVVNITNPSNPQSVANLTSSGTTWGVFVDGDHAYLSDQYSGLRVIDISDPTNPSEVGSFVSGGRILHSYIEGDYAFVSDYDFGLRVLDISTPSSPLEVGNVSTPGTSYRLDIAGNYLYLADDDYGLQVINITIPYSPLIVATHSTSGQVRGVSVDGNYAYLADADFGLQVVNITNPVHPDGVGGYDTPGSSWDVSVSGDHAYLAGFYYGMWTFNISDPTNPIVVNQYENSDRSMGLAIEGKHAFLCDGDDGIKIVQIIDPFTSVSATYYDPGTVDSVCVDGNYAYIAESVSNDLLVMDITDPTQVTQVGSYTGLNFASGLTVEGDLLFISNLIGSTGFQILNISDPTNLTLVDVYLASFRNDPIVVGDYAYVCGFTGKTLHAFNISDPSDIILDWSFTTSDPVSSVCVSGNYVYIGDFQRVTVLDLDNPTVAAGYWDESEGPPAYVLGWDYSDLQVAGNYLYAAGGGPGMLVFDISVPTDPTPVGIFSFPDYSNSLKIIGDLAYVSGGDSGLCVANISDPTNPTLAWSYSTPTFCIDIDVEGNYVYLADGPAGLGVAKISESLCRFDEIISVAQSTVIFSSSTNIISEASISLEGDYVWQFPDEDIMIYVSADGGRHWEYFIPTNSSTSFLYLGSELCWKIELYTDSEFASPIISSMTIHYSTILGFDYFEEFDETTFMDGSQSNVTGWGGGQISITGSPGSYNSLEVAQSNQIATLSYGVFAYAQVRTNKSTPAGTSIEIYLSADDGLHWEQVFGFTRYFYYPGNQLKWKAHLTTTDDNVTPILFDISIVVTLAPPQVSPDDGVYTSDSTPTFIWASLPGVSDYLFSAYAWNGSQIIYDEFFANGTTQYTPTSPFFDGIWNWNVAGYYSPQSPTRYLIVDTLQPTWNQSLSNQMFEYGDEIGYRVNASDLNGIHHYWLNDTSYFTIDEYGVVTNSTITPVGTHSVEIRAYDPAGLFCTSSITIEVADNTLPIWVQSPADREIEFGTATSFQVEAEDLDGIHHYWLDDTTYFVIDDYGFISNSSFVPVGDYVLEVRAYDESNNYCTEDITLTIEDTTAPIWIDSPEPQVLDYGDSLSYQLGAFDLSSIVSWTLNDTVHFSITDGLITNIATLEPGIYTISVSVQDTYGNIVSDTFNVIVVLSGATTPAPPLDITPLILVVGGVAGVAAVAVLLFLMKRRRS